MVVVAKKERQDISFNHYTVNSRQEILCEPRATYILCKEIYIYFERSRVLPKKERQDISSNHYIVNSRQEILCEPRATYILCKDIYIYILKEVESYLPP